MPKIKGRFSFKRTDNGNLIGEWSNDREEKNFTESADLKKLSIGDSAYKYDDNYISTWQEGGSPRIADLTIKKINRQKYSLLWQTPNTTDAMFKGEGMIKRQIDKYRIFVPLTGKVDDHLKDEFLSARRIFYDHFEDYKIYIPKDTVDKIQDFIDQLDEVEFEYYLADVNKDKVIIQNAYDKIPSLLQAMEEDFQRNLGFPIKRLEKSTFIQEIAMRTKKLIAAVMDDKIERKIEIP